MDGFSTALNQILVEAYHNVLDLEERSLRQSKVIPLSINEMHLIECVGKAPRDEGITVSEVAQAMNITRPSATAAINKLERKGYLTKRTCQSDGRVVRVYLTREGKKVDAYHAFYHRQMVHSIARGMDDREKSVLLQAIENLNVFFKESIEQL